MTALVFVDTNLWVYALVASGDRRHGLARQWLATLGQTPVINGQVLREIGRILKDKARIDEEELRYAMIRLYATCRLVPDSQDLFLRASRLRETHAFSYWDSLIVAAALEGSCVTLFTEDMQHGQVIEGVLTILNPFGKE
ncbi:MAG: PIN domain-containing protein [Magnetococcales bacterium]|nr:PIN domain-containing protein [Magnetococcales bacterium]MBF0150551.1 PIN domain-containing protein [Magnetococcales bacterium]MBF0174830.1 PIN domain-containing protein [Magnetococcales bacterium]MBF0348704.1 PIN domain-containing protein [Magnetococcales bacterium]MBF0631768.1 PIN domain-containing protein [Magnetococcales bacterium]